MKITHLTLVAVLLLQHVALHAQTLPHSPNVTKNGKRDGHWTIWFDAEWLPTTDQDKVKFYRTITYTAGKPPGLVTDYFANGKRQWQGYLITDEPVDKIEGVATWFNDDGIKLEEARFTDGIKQESKIFLADGSPDTLGTNEAMATVFFDLGQYQKALVHYTHVVSFFKNTSGSDHPDYASSLNTMATIHIASGQLKDAEACLYEALRIRKKVFGEDHPLIASSLNNLSVVYDEMGQYDKAQKYQQQVLDIRKKNGLTETMDYAISLNNMALLDSRLNRLEEAEEALRESLRIRRLTHNDHELDYANTTSNLASLLAQMGKPEKAESLFLESIDLFKSIAGEEHPDYANTLSSLSNLYVDLGRLDKGEQLLVQALNIRKATLGENHYLYAVSLNNLAFIYSEEKNYAKAELLHRQALEIRKNALGADHPEVSNSLNNLGLIYHMTGRYHKAEGVYKEAIDIRKKKFGERHPFYLNMVNNMAKLYQSQQRYAESEALFLNNIRVVKETQGEDRSLYLTALFNLASLYQEMRDLEKSERYFAASTQKLVELIDRYFTAFSEKEKEEFYKSEKENFSNYNAFCLNRYAARPAIAGEMFNMQLFTKGLLLNSQTKWKERILHSGDTALLTLYDTWVMKQGQIARLYNADDSLSHTAASTLENETQALEKDLSQRSELFAKLADKKRYTWQDVQQKLKPGEAAVEIIRCAKYGFTRMITDTSDVARPSYPRYYLTDTIQYAALIITPQSKQPQLVLLENGSLLENRYLPYYRNCIGSQVQDVHSYNMFWKPIASALGKKIKKVYFSPDGVYNLINLTTLYHQETKRYLLEETDIQRVTTTRDLASMAARSGENITACLVGHPNYEAAPVNSDTATFREVKEEFSAIPSESVTLTDLPGTQTEIENIARLLTNQKWKPDVRTGNMAREEVIKNADKPRVLHIATHGYFEPDATQSTTINPLLRSGLMLTGASRTLQGYSDEMSDDGILTAYEAMTLNLDNTDLVVLSACETGLGEVINGEGVYGLQRAFTVAGARSVIMSMWKVNDEATQSMLTMFYEYWLKTGNKNLALKQAQLAIKKKYYAPYYWGAFVIVGVQ